MLDVDVSDSKLGRVDANNGCRDANPERVSEITGDGDAEHDRLSRNHWAQDGNHDRVSGNHGGRIETVTRTMQREADRGLRVNLVS